MPSGLSEIVLIVADVKNSAAFYRDVVQLIPESDPDDGWAWFWAGEPGVTQRIALHKGPLLWEGKSPLAGGQRWGPIHFALHVPRSQHAGAVAHVRSKGVEVYGPTRIEWMKAMSYYFYDPDANLVEFWSPDPDSDRAARTAIN